MNEFEQTKQLLAWASGFCLTLQRQIMESKNEEEMFKIQKQHAETCPRCKGNLFCFGGEEKDKEAPVQNPREKEEGDSR